jgi:hypothetical protein
MLRHNMGTLRQCARALRSFNTAAARASQQQQQQQPRLQQENFPVQQTLSAEDQEVQETRQAAEPTNTDRNHQPLRQVSGAESLLCLTRPHGPR